MTLRPRRGKVPAGDEGPTKRELTVPPINGSRVVTPTSHSVRSRETTCRSGAAPPRPPRTLARSEAGRKRRSPHKVPPNPVRFVRSWARTRRNGWGVGSRGSDELGVPQKRNKGGGGPGTGLYYDWFRVMLLYRVTDHRHGGWSVSDSFDFVSKGSIHR